jgi:predicted aconitase with swiveling domain
MKKIILRGRKVYGGKAEGEAVVTNSSWAVLMAMDIDTGTVTERGHELKGVNLKDKVLVFPRAKGSSGYSMGAQALRLAGTSPKALVIKEINPQAALGAVVMRIPAVCDLDQDPAEVISTDDWVKVDAENGTIEISKKHI